MKVTLWGTRGPLPSAGPETVRYGGNSSWHEKEDSLLARAPEWSQQEVLMATMEGLPPTI